MKNTLISSIIACVLVGAGAFLGGMQYQKSQVSSQFPKVMGRNVGGQFGKQDNASAGVRPVSGEVTSLDDGSITVKMPDSSSKIVVIASSTTFKKTADAAKSDLVAGVTVQVLGTTNSDGTMTADSVSII